MHPSQSNCLSCQHGKVLTREKWAQGSNSTEDLSTVVQHVKKEFGLDFVYCWHALHAYWSGVSATAAGVESYGSQITIPTPTPGACALLHIEAGAYKLHDMEQTLQVNNGNCIVSLYCYGPLVNLGM